MQSYQSDTHSAFLINQIPMCLALISQSGFCATSCHQSYWFAPSLHQSGLGEQHNNLVIMQVTAKK